MFDRLYVITLMGLLRKGGKKMMKLPYRVWILVFITIVLVIAMAGIYWINGRMFIDFSDPWRGIAFIAMLGAAAYLLFRKQPL